jgi:hypothetical protein
MSDSSELITVEKRKRGRPKKEQNKEESAANKRPRVTRETLRHMTRETLSHIITASENFIEETEQMLQEEEQQLSLAKEALESKGGMVKTNNWRGEKRNFEIAKHYVDYCLANKAYNPRAKLLGAGFIQFFNVKMLHKNEGELTASQPGRYLNTILVCKLSN